MDWATRWVLCWRLSNTMGTEFCIEALEDAFRLHGRPEIFNTDQGSQFTSPRFTRALLDATVKVSMDGRGRWMDNLMIERLWRSLKYECVYLHAFETGSAARAGIGKWMTFYNTERPHSALGGRTPIEAHQDPGPKAAAWSPGKLSSAANLFGKWGPPQSGAQGEASIWPFTG